MQKEIYKTVETPCFVWNIDVLNRRVRFLREHLGRGVRIIYAMKANPFLVDFLKESDGVDGFEVCSMGEFRICEKYGVPMEKIVLSGVNKSSDELEYIIGTYGGTIVYTIESERQLYLLQKIAQKHGMILRCLVRLTSGSQFGNDPEVVKHIFIEEKRYPNLKLQGVQFFSGTMKKKLKKHGEELKMLDKFIEELEEKCHDTTICELEYGPGFGITYFENEADSDEAVLLDGFSGILDGMRFKGQISLEIGRFLAGHCGTYITSVADKKRSHGQNFLIVDGGINHMNYYGQMMGMKVPRHDFIRMNIEETEDAKVMPGEVTDGNEKLCKYTVCGSLCTTSDVLVREIKLPEPAIGDRIAFHRIGAYSVTEGIYLFLSRDLPAVYAYSEETGLKLVRKRKETCELNMRNVGSSFQ